MRFSVPKLSHTFLRMGFLVILAGALFTPLAAVFAQGSDINGNGQIDSWEVFTNTGNNPGNPDAPGYYGVFDTVTDSDGNVVYDTDGDGIADEGETSAEPNPPATGAEFLQQSAYQSQVRLEDSHGLLVTVGGWIASTGGNMFELAYTNFALKMGCYFVAGGAGCDGDGILEGDGQVGDVVNVLWEVIRDLINIAIIFSLVYIGFMLIVNGDDSSTKKALGSIIMAALLVNFSLYIAKVVVDVSNLTTTAIYSAMSAAGDSDFGIEGENTDGDIRVSSSANGSSLASHFMTVLQITSMYNVTGDIVNELSFAILAMFFLIFLGAIFAYGAIMLIARFIAIIVLLIFSPVMFLGMVLPKFQGISADWRKKFFGYCLYAPAFTFMIYISLYTLIQMAPETDNGNGYGAAFNGDGADAVGSMPLFLFFFIGTGLLFMSTKVAGTIASGSGDFLTKTADGFAKKLTIGMAGAGGALVYRNTAGAAANQVLKGMDRFDRSLAGAQSKVSKMSNWNPAKLALGAGLYAGREAVGGTATRGAVEGAVNYGAFGGRGRKQSKDDLDAQNKRVASQKSEAELKANVSGGLKSAPTSPERIKLERSIADASGSQIEGLGAGKLSNKVVAGALSSSQFESVMKSDKFTDTQKEAIAGARKDATTEKLTDTATGRVKVESASVAQLEALGTEYIEQNAGLLTPSQLDDLKKKLTESEFGRIKGANKTALLTMVGSANPQNAFNQPDGTPKKDKDVAQLPAEVLMHANAPDFLNANILKNILDKETLNATQRAALKGAILNPAPGQPWNSYTPAQQNQFNTFFASPLGSSF